MKVKVEGVKEGEEGRKVGTDEETWKQTQLKARHKQS